VVYQLVANGNVPDEDYFNNALMKQAVIVCTSGTRPSSPVEGMTIYETDTDRHMVYSGSGWEIVLQQAATTYSPSWGGSTTNPTLGNGTLTGRYVRISRKLVYVSIYLAIGSTSTGGTGRWTFSLPVTPGAAEQTLTALGNDNSAAFRWGGSAYVTSGSDVLAVALGSGGNIGVSSNVPFTWGQLDALLISGIYEAA
jgi:hypothetical protein